MFLRKIRNFFIVVLVILPLVMWTLWYFSPKKTISAFIMDKTVLIDEGLEHKCFDWVLNYDRFVKKDGTTYDRSKDYYGFFPKPKQEFEIKDLQSISLYSIDQLCKQYDLCFFTDTYGIYRNEWTSQVNTGSRSGLMYGGLTEKEIYFLHKMKEQNKLILAEYNFLATPTTSTIKSKAEKEFGMRWSGWTGRHFQNLDTFNNPDLPRWVVTNYKRLHNNTWPFKHGGMVFNNEDETIVILEEEKDLVIPVPEIKTRPDIIAEFDLPSKMRYPYWFDINYFSPENEALAVYDITTTKRGDSLLNAYNIPKKFPAVVRNKTNKLFYYFSGDFSDNPIAYNLSYFKGTPALKSFFYTNDIDDRRSFFWKYYRPLVTKIVNDYYLTIQ
ncbi:hypothetical protein [Limnovirga soli]|uniref:Uncharacterized protein n=1 Tax=Limnovirga soli TaxID=2656915 RepID=A0A8J8JTF3_9BACT|nr:hypothetical protein [Limnovirga soli]NNV55863.1 hypothetical protein [Limnovirga soli]